MFDQTYCKVEQTVKDMTNIMQLVRNESGVTAIEYALIASLIAIVILGALTLVGTNLNAIYTDVASKL